MACGCVDCWSQISRKDTKPPKKSPNVTKRKEYKISHVCTFFSQQKKIREM